MQKTLFIKLSIIAALCVIFAIGLSMFSQVITERQYYADSVVEEIADQHVNPQEIITPFIAIPTTVTPECIIAAADQARKCAAPYTSIDTIFASQTSTTQQLSVSTDTYQRGIYHATSYSGDIKFKQSYVLNNSTEQIAATASTSADTLADSEPVTTPSPNTGTDTSLLNNTESATYNDQSVAKQTLTHWNEAKLIIPVSDLRGVATLPTITLDKRTIKATYPNTSMINGLSYVEVALPDEIITQLRLNAIAGANENKPLSNTLTANRSVATGNGHTNSANTGRANTASANKEITLVIDLPLAGISSLNTVPTGQNFELSMLSNWHAPNFIGKALPNAKEFTADGFEANWQNQYLTVANNQYLSQCLSTANHSCTVDSKASIQSSSQSADFQAAVVVVEDAMAAADNATYANQGQLSSVRLNSFGVSFAEPNDVYLQTERTMKYALLLILVSFGTFFLFEVIKSSRIHPIQYLLVGCALLTFYVLLLPLAEQIAFWQAYAIAASACVGLIGWYSYYVLGGVKRAAIFTAILAVLYAAFYGILTTEDLNLLLGAVFCFILLAGVMVMTRKIDWYKLA